MKAERWQKVEEIYHSTLEKEPDERPTFLSAACAGDEELRREVESLLAYEDRAREFIETPALEVTAKMMANESVHTIEAGQTIRQYRIRAALGAGGMGEVYLADDTRLGRRVALKFLPQQLTQDKIHLRRFEQEARAVAALSHPNVCAIHEVVETAEGRHCIVMEYVEGATLRDRIAEGRIDVSEAVDIGIQVASALAAAHEAGIVHRDIKPENIMLRRDGYVKVLDFGLAKLSQTSAEEDTNATEFETVPGMLLGTAAYMSPEQARGIRVDARTDVWSLGVVLYEIVSGRRPFEGATPTDLIVSVVEREPVPLADRAAGVPAGFEIIVSKALAKDPDKRYQAADEMLADLKALRRRLEVAAQNASDQRTGPGMPHKTTSGIGERDRSRFFASSLTGRNLLMISAVVGAFLIAGLTAVLYFRQSPSATPTGIKSLAVLPLDNLSGEDSQDYFADGMTEALITDLAKISQLRVASRGSVMQYKGSRKPLEEIGSALNVDAVLTGSVIRSGERVRISVQLSHAATGLNLWTDSYERSISDVLALQSEVARDIARQIRIKLTPQEQIQVESSAPIDPEAYDHYLRGKFYLYRQNKEGNETAIAELERAVDADPNFAAAHSELAQAYVWKLFLFAPDQQQLAEKAYVEAEKALALNPNLAVAYLARGRLLWTPANHFPHERAIREYRRALQLDPNLDEARNQLAVVYNHIGAFDEALQELQRAVETNPGNSLAQYRIGETLLFQGKYEEALTGLRSVPSEVNPALAGHQIVWALFNLGRRDEAAATLEQFLKDYPDDNRGLYTSLQAVLAAADGRQQVAEEKIKSAIDNGKGFGHFHHTAYHIACAYAIMKKNDQAIKWLEAAAEDGFPCYPLFERDPNLDNLRRDPRFADFMAKQRQQWQHYRTVL